MEIVVFLLLFIASVVFAFFDSSRFIQYAGNLQRGIKVGTGPLSTEMIRFLRELKTDIIEEETKAFIRKEGESVLIQPIPHIRKHYLGLWTIGLVDLSLKRPQIEFRTPVSSLFLFLLLTSSMIYQIFFGNDETVTGTVCTLIFIPIFFVMTHPFSKNVVVEYVEEAMQQKRG